MLKIITKPNQLFIEAQNDSGELPKIKTFTFVHSDFRRIQYPKAATKKVFLDIFRPTQDGSLKKYFDYIVHKCRIGNQGRELFFTSKQIDVFSRKYRSWLTPSGYTFFFMNMVDLNNGDEKSFVAAVLLDGSLIKIHYFDLGNPLVFSSKEYHRLVVIC